MTGSDVLETLRATPRTSLGALPTPLRAAPNLASLVDLPGDAVWLKLDGYTGFGLGGNKVRKLETELAPSRLDGIDTLISCGGPQSNSLRVVAAAAARLGRRCILVVNGSGPEPPVGNARLHALLTPYIVRVADRVERAPAMEAAAREVEAEGGRALVVPLGASTPRGALGYALAMLELKGQMDLDPAWDPDATRVFVASSSAGTLAGMLLGASVLGMHGLKLVGVSADDPAEDVLQAAIAIASDAAALIGFDGDLLTGSVTVTDAFVGEGYGVPTPAADAATLLFARSEGVLLDPTYTSKAAAGMVDWIASGNARASERIVFWHTGGEVTASLPRYDGAPPGA